VDSTKLTRANIAQILGPSVPFNYQVGSEQRIYDEQIHYWVVENYSNSLHQLFHAMMMINMRANGSLDCFWIVVKSKTKAKNLLLIAIPRHDRYEETKTKLHDKVFFHIAHGFDLNRHSGVFNAMVNDIQINFDVELVIITDASDSELKRMNDFKNTLQSSLSILIPVVGNAKLTAFNCDVDNSELCNLFYGDSNESTQAIVTQKGGIAVQVKVMGCTISFDESVNNGGGSSVGGIGGNHDTYHNIPVVVKGSSEDKGSIDMDQLIQHHHQTERQQLPQLQQQQYPSIDFEYDIDDIYNNNNIIVMDADEIHEVKSSPLIHELPLGYRILNCCQQLIGKPKRKVLLIGTDVKSDVNKALSATPGSAEYAVAQNDKLIGNDKDKNKKKDRSQPRIDKLDIPLKCINPSWNNLRSIKTIPSVAASYDGDDHNVDLSDINSFLPKQSMLSVSVHLGHEPLFAMAYKTLIVGLEGNVLLIYNPPIYLPIYLSIHLPYLSTYLPTLPIYLSI